MGTSKLEVMWSPLHTNRFITWGNDIYLYEVRPQKDHVKQSDIIISENTIARLLSTNSNHRYVKCIDIYPRHDDTLLAVGQANGKVCLSTFGPSMFDAMGLAGMELGPKYPRQCNSLMWNPIEVNLLATGFEKHRSDHSIQIWDVLKAPVQTRSIGLTPSPPVEHARPIFETGLSDTAHAVAWFNQSPHTLVVGVNNRNLKIVDIRDVSCTVLSAPTKASVGVSVAPYNQFHIASYGENIISLWDVRNFERSILHIPQNKLVTKVSWCPTRRNLIGSLLKESPAIHLHDMQQSMEENEPSSLNRSVQPGQNVPITSFSWHPKDENRLIAIYTNGVLTDYLVFERMTLNWSPSSHIVWTYGRRHLKMISEKDRIYANIHDLVPKMKQRAQAEYGLKPELWRNGELCENESLQVVWQWLYMSKCLADEGVVVTERSVKHPGVRCVLGLDNHAIVANECSESVYSQWSETYSSVITYRSTARDNAMLLCGWKFDKDGSILDRLELEGAFTRAATIAIFNLKLRTAIDILNRGATRNKPNLAVIAMALSGFSADKKSLWRELCLSTKEQLSDPYLKSAFSFLASELNSYESILNETGMSIDDRIAFACKFLSDNQLTEYLTQLTNIVIEEGDVTGLVLTGTCDGCLPLLQSYLDITGDVQSVSAIAVRAFSTSLLHDDITSQAWINSYRLLLDGWQLWNERVKFDIYLNAEKTPEPQVYISCNYCGKSISTFIQEETQSRKSPQSTSSGKGKSQSEGGTQGNPQQPYDDMSSCPNCHKPLPRCSICLSYMGTLSTFTGREDKNTSSNTTKVSEFSSWFTWCQTCRHGGHAGHILQWFEENPECAVTGCSCHCFTLDG